MGIKSVFIKVFAAIFAGVMLLLVGTGPKGSYDVYDPENCKLNFTVISDTHIEGNNLNRFKIFANGLDDVKNNASGNDAILFLGDNTMNGQGIESMFFYGTIAKKLKGEKLMPIIGNHDIGNGEGDYAKLQQRWYDYMYACTGRKLTKPYYYEVIDGYYFIVLGMEDQLVYEMYMSDEQFAWLEGLLEEADASGKPVFVFNHYPSDDVIDADGSYSNRLTNLLAEYNTDHDLFYFCGHTHMPLYLFWSFKDYYGYPEIYLPRMTELAGADDNEIFDNSGIAVEVEVYENKVVVRGRDFLRGEWRIDDEDTGELCEYTYDLKCPIA